MENKKSTGRPRVQNEIKKKVRSVRVSDKDMATIIKSSGSLQTWVDSHLRQEHSSEQLRDDPDLESA